MYGVMNVDSQTTRYEHCIYCNTWYCTSYKYSTDNQVLYLYRDDTVNLWGVGYGVGAPGTSMKYKYVAQYALCTRRSADAEHGVRSSQGFDRSIASFTQVILGDFAIVHSTLNSLKYQFSFHYKGITNETGSPWLCIVYTSVILIPTRCL